MNEDKNDSDDNDDEDDEENDLKNIKEEIDKFNIDYFESHKTHINVEEIFNIFEDLFNQKRPMEQINNEISSDEEIDKNDKNNKKNSKNKNLKSNSKSKNLGKNIIYKRLKYFHEKTKFITITIK